MLGKKPPKTFNLCWVQGIDWWPFEVLWYLILLHFKFSIVNVINKIVLLMCDYCSENVIIYNYCNDSVIVYDYLFFLNDDVIILWLLLVEKSFSDCSKCLCVIQELAEDLTLVSVIPHDPEVKLLSDQTYNVHLGPDTGVTFLSSQYRLSFTLDLSPSLMSVVSWDILRHYATLHGMLKKLFFFFF